MSFNLDTFKEKLKSKGISIQAEANCVIAGLSWWVEGIEKAPRLGNLLFYVVNGTRYGVKPSKKAKHDIEWYYDQLKTGMKGAKGYSAGLTQFLNAWVKKGELDIVFKGKVKASEIGASSVTASAELEKLAEMLNTKIRSWDDSIVYDRFTMHPVLDYIEVRDERIDIGGAKKIVFSGSASEVIEFLKQQGCKVTAARAQIVDEEMKKKFEDFQKKVQDISFFGKKPFVCYITKENGVVYVFIETEKCITLISDNQEEIDNALKRFNYMNVSSDPNKAALIYDPEAHVLLFNDEENGCIYQMLSIDTINFDKVYEALKRDCKDIENAVREVKGLKVTAASPRKYRPSIRERMDRDSYLDPMDFDISERKNIEKFNKFKKEVQSIKLLGRTPFNAFASIEDKDEDLKKAKTGSHEGIEDINLEFRNECIQVKCSDIEMDRLDDNLTVLNEKYKFKILDYVGNGKFMFGPSFGGNETLLVLQPDELDCTLKELRTECKLIESVVKPFSNVKVTADLEEGENPETEILAFIDDVNGLTIRGKRVFNAEKKGEDIVITLLINKFETSDMDRLNELVEDKLEILFPITQKWMDADKGQTFGNNAKVGDIVMYTSEWSSQKFSNQLIIDWCSKIDWQNLPFELHSLYNTLSKDCSTLETNLFKITADVCEVKETLGELNKENFEGINQEHDRLMYMKVSPQDFISMWKTSTKFNPTQLNKIVFGFKLASRILGSKFENSGIKIEYFFKRQDGKGYIRVEYKDELYIIYVAQSDDNGDIKVVTRKMKKMIPVKNFNLLSTSVSSLAFENATLPPNFKKVWEEVSKD